MAVKRVKEEEEANRLQEVLVELRARRNAQGEDEGCTGEMRKELDKLKRTKKGDAGEAWTMFLVCRCWFGSNASLHLYTFVCVGMAFAEGMDPAAMHQVRKRTWLEARRCRGGKGVEFEVDSDSQLTRGVAAIACEALRGKDAQQVARIDVQEFGKEIGLSQAFLAPSHANGFQNLVNAMKKRAAVLQAQDEADGADVPEAVRFPSLRITADDVEAEGSFAAAQAQFLRPDLEQVKELVHVIQVKRIGVVATSTWILKCKGHVPHSTL
eukprot:jgi/Pico_ML_1/54224/g27.t1